MITETHIYWHHFYDKNTLENCTQEGMHVTEKTRSVPEREDVSERAVRLRGLTSREPECGAAAAMPCGGLWEFRSKSQKSRSTSPISEDAREVGGLIPTLTPTLTRAGGERAAGLVSGEELETSEQLSSPMAERLSVATPEPSTSIPPPLRPPLSTLAIRRPPGHTLTHSPTRSFTKRPTDWYGNECREGGMLANLPVPLGDS